MSPWSHRLSTGGLIQRDHPVTFHFDGRRYNGFQGDTLASALLAAGVKLFGRSFKYHRPRGLLTAGAEEPNALVELRTGARREPNTKATLVELFEGVEARSQNRWPSLRFDVGALHSLFSPLLVAGFYYKSFMWPAAFWERVYEPLIRRAAGLGRASALPDPDSYEKAHAFCDVLVIGAGPAGLSAALAAGRAGARVILCEEDFVLGGRLCAERHEVDGLSGVSWAQRAEAELASMTDVRIFKRTAVFGAYDGQAFGALERVADHLAQPPPHQPRQRLWKIVAKRAVLATGAIERPIVFGGNDRPGVMMASAVRTYLNRFGVVPGRRAVLFTTTDDGWKTAFDLQHAGVRVEAIVESRNCVRPELQTQGARIATRVMLGAKVIDVRGAHAVHEVIASDRSDQRTRIAADTLAICGGWNPNLALWTHRGARPRWSDAILAFVPDGRSQGLIVAGAARGSLSLAAALNEGTAAGAEAALCAGFVAPHAPAPLAAEESTEVDARPPSTRPRAKAFVDFQLDVTHADVELAAREGFGSVELLKRYTTLGMGTDQGKTSNLNGQAVLARLAGSSPEQLGLPGLRPPCSPVALGAFAGHHRGKRFKPTRLTAAHGWAVGQRAKFVDAGLWLRAQWFTQPGETGWLQSVTREVHGVRSRVGVCDVSTLGKIEMQGSDAAVFLDRIYTNTMSTLPAGKVRYGLMLREDGFVLDDGTVAHLGSGRYVLSTTTANAARVLQHLEHARQVLWPELDVQLDAVTEQWAQYAIAGPHARNLLERALDGALDVSNAAFSYLACAELDWRGLAARLFRISFSGELAYELAVPAHYGDDAIRALMSAGAEWNVTPYGTEALGVMRIEKGHVAGNEINGTTTAFDLGLEALLATRKDFIGRVLAGRAALKAPDRLRLVGIRPLERDTCLRAGAHLLPRGAALEGANDQGYLTSVAFSPTLDSWIGLALLASGEQRRGERVRACDPLRGGEVEVEVMSPRFYDPDGTRLRG